MANVFHVVESSSTTFAATFRCLVTRRRRLFLLSLKCLGDVRTRSLISHSCMTTFFAKLCRLLSARGSIWISQHTRSRRPFALRPFRNTLRRWVLQHHNLIIIESTVLTLGLDTPIIITLGCTLLRQVLQLPAMHHLPVFAHVIFAQFFWCCTHAIFTVAPCRFTIELVLREIWLHAFLLLRRPLQVVIVLQFLVVTSNGRKILVNLNLAAIEVISHPVMSS